MRIHGIEPMKIIITCRQYRILCNRCSRATSYRPSSRLAQVEPPAVGYFRMYLARGPLSAYTEWQTLWPYDVIQNLTTRAVAPAADTIRPFMLISAAFARRTVCLLESLEQRYRRHRRSPAPAPLHQLLFHPFAASTSRHRAPLYLINTTLAKYATGFRSRRGKARENARGREEGGGGDNGMGEKD